MNVMVLWHRRDKHRTSMHDGKPNSNGISQPTTHQQPLSIANFVNVQCIFLAVGFSHFELFGRRFSWVFFSFAISKFSRPSQLDHTKFARRTRHNRDDNNKKCMRFLKWVFYAPVKLYCCKNVGCICESALSAWRDMSLPKQYQLAVYRAHFVPRLVLRQFRRKRKTISSTIITCVVFVPGYAAKKFVARQIFHSLYLSSLHFVSDKS